MTHSLSEPSFAADFALPFPCRRASAGVAAPSFPMATTVQHVLVLGLWLVGDSQWRVRSPASVGGGRVATNRMIRDLDLAIPSAGDSRRIEVIVDGLSLFGGAQLAVDATMVSPVRADGLPREGAAARDGVALTTARQRKQRTFPELSGHQHRCRLVVLATDVGGRWSLETRDFLRAQESGTGMAVAVVVHPVVHSCSSSGFVIGGQVGRCWG